MEPELKYLLHQKDSNYIAYAPLRESLEEIYNNDQRFRSQIAGAEGENHQKALASLNDSIGYYDKKNFTAIKEILEKYGWPSTDKVEATASRAIFLVIQHSGSPEFESFKPLIEKAHKESNISPSEYALYIDRYNVNTTGKQLYGTQFYFDSTKQKQVMFPLKDPMKVNDLRKEVGLRPLRQ